ncbi:uncharacterized protein LOC127004517 isoform X1 [Eriocheir sinensis]|uniref:uncharacterized protein LOC127004517 isoform X1 n=1 Tax=Eriocheir sinensis TaxID=95602 RepID=UPI0021C86872|nr:uncharacterized protein LOC127004517 isoform X1 [Eriocheir sinensis]XP_050728286.1 uncharacterized protein LOC127004517 isoform X1 [Eriocheir sinensis]XP_050728287.1 uncharacterized protein LOC127004517 isoform X1 [Eriocheir sinensis]XP_050728288.1 uncharacterized protein LOC127004517 isoform X1 [Eriocheir sinensis]XP_050728290.1 uncharacterized protein LOC127004517 isoform X1 [Eriocheir sinensis]
MMPSTAEAEGEAPFPSRRREGYISTDSEDNDEFDVVRTLQHYRQGQSSSSSECSCESCISGSDESFFGGEEGPPRGEATTPRRAFVWLETSRERWGFVVLGLLMTSCVLSAAGLVVTEILPSSEIGGHMLYWTLPLVVVCGLCISVWTAARYLLVRGGYSKGGHIIERRNLISDAQAKELVYSVQGAIYAPTRHNSPGHNSPPVYNVVAYENEFDSSTYITSDLEHDGQYCKRLVPGQEADDSHTERCNIYSRRAWFRDVPLVWWELLLSNQKDL